MSRFKYLGHINPVATHIIAFLMGVSLLFETHDEGALGPWKGVLISLSQKNIDYDYAYLVKRRKSPTCLLHSDPFYLHRKNGDTLGILIPKDTKYSYLIREIVAKKVNLRPVKAGLPLCPSLEKVRYG